MKKIIIVCILMMFGIVGCNSQVEEEPEIKKLLMCTKDSEVGVFDFDENDKVKSIYYELVFDLNDYFTEKELEEFDMYKGVIYNLIDDYIMHCDDLEYACNSKYENYLITNKIYVDSYESAKASGLNEYYGISAVDARTKMVANNGAVCQEIDKTEYYIVKGNKTEIIIEGDSYDSIDQVTQESSKPVYYKEYPLINNEGKEGTITFKENGICEIDLTDFNSEVFAGAYCDKDRNKILYKTNYLNGNCSYVVSDDYYFDITYSGQYESGRQCETYDDNSQMHLYNIVDNPNNLIKIKFDELYSEFEFLNGKWRKVSLLVPLEYK